MSKNFFTGVRKVYVKDHNEVCFNGYLPYDRFGLNYQRAKRIHVISDHFQATEFCPHCLSLGYEKKLRYFFLNLDEAIWKCSSATCLYPFENFRFKNFTEDKVYMYERIDDGSLMCNTTVQCGTTAFKEEEDVKLKPNTSTMNNSVQSPAHHSNIEEFDFDAFTAEFFKTDSPAESQSSFEMKCDFDLMDGFECQTEFKQDAVAVEEPIDFNGLNDILDDLINENSSTNSTMSPVKCSQVDPCEELIAPVVNSERAIDLEQEDIFVEHKFMEMPRPKLSKCLKHIEAKIKVKMEKLADDERSLDGDIGRKEADFGSRIAHSTGGRKARTKCKKKSILPIIRKSPAKSDNVNSNLFSLLSHKHNFKPLSILERLTSMDISGASIQTLPSRGRPKIETNLQKELRLQRRTSTNEGIAKLQRVA